MVLCIIHVMAIIYGKSDAEKELLRILPKEVKSLEDVYNIKFKFEDRLKNTKGFWGFIKRRYYRYQLSKFEGREFKIWYKGASGEKKTLYKLLKLNNSYHVLVGLRYKNRRRKTVQFDFVVVGHTGVYLLEVKHWSDSYAKSPDKDPFKQTTREEDALYELFGLGFYWGGDFAIKSIILSIKNNILPNSDYQNIQTTGLNNIYNIITGNRDIMSKKTVLKLVEKLTRKCTYEQHTEYQSPNE